MRCLFTMFAEDVELLRERTFSNAFDRSLEDPAVFPSEVDRPVDEDGSGRHASASGGRMLAVQRRPVRRTGRLCRSTEQQLDAADRAAGKRLGGCRAGHLRHAARTGARSEGAPTPRRALHAARLRRAAGAPDDHRAAARGMGGVRAAAVQPLDADAGQDDGGRAVAEVSRFPRAALRRSACSTRPAAPATSCTSRWTLMKRLEGEVLELLRRPRRRRKLAAATAHTSTPQQFLGIEINPRAAAIAELVLWIGYLQWHFRTRGDDAPRRADPPRLPQHRMPRRAPRLRRRRVPRLDERGNR